jgi:hypothetical protein
MTVDLDDGLRELGLAPQDINALLLVPAAAVAWADGEPDMKQIEAIAETHAGDCEEGDCLRLAENARKFVYHNFVYRRPKPDLLRTALSCLAVMLFSLPRDKADRLRRLVFSVAMDVAVSGGGNLRGRRPIDITEKMAIANVAGALGFYDIALLKKLIEEGP